MSLLPASAADTAAALLRAIADRAGVVVEPATTHMTRRFADARPAAGIATLVDLAGDPAIDADAIDDRINRDFLAADAHSYFNALLAGQTDAASLLAAADQVRARQRAKTK